MEGNVNWVNFRTRRQVTREEWQLEAIGRQLKEVLADTIVFMSRGPIDLGAFASREDRITKAANGLVAIDVYETPGVESSGLIDEKAIESIYTNTYALLETLTEAELEAANVQADEILDQSS